MGDALKDMDSKVQDRLDRIGKLGLFWNAGYDSFVNGDFNIGMTEVKTFSDEAFDNLLAKIKLEMERRGVLPVNEPKVIPLNKKVAETTVAPAPEKKVSIFGAAKVKPATKSAKDDKIVVEIPGLEEKLLKLQTLKGEIADGEAQLAAITDEIKSTAKEKFLELYKANKTNPNTFLIKDGSGCVTVIPMDKYLIVKDEDRANQLIDEYGKEVVTVDEKYYFNPEVLERNQDVIEELIANSTAISDADKENMLKKEVKYSIAKGMIDDLYHFGNKMENAIADIQPIFMLKNCGGKAEEGGVIGSGDLIDDVPVKLGYSLCCFAPVYGDAGICSHCGEKCTVISEEEVRNEIAEAANEEGSEENEQRWEARGYSAGGNINGWTDEMVNKVFSAMLDEMDVYKAEEVKRKHVTVEQKKRWLKGEENKSRKQYAEGGKVNDKMVYKIREYNMIGKILYTSEAMPQLEKRETQKNGKEYFVYKGTNEEYPTPSPRFLWTLTDKPKNGAIDASEKFLPYFADVTEDIPSSYKIKPKTYKNCQLMTETHGGYYQFYDKPSGKILRIAINSHNYRPVEGDKLAQGGSVEDGEVIVKSKEAKSHNEVWDILNKWGERYRIVNAPATDLETPYNRGWIDEGNPILVSLKKVEEKGKPTYYVWKWKQIDGNGKKFEGGGDAGEKPYYAHGGVATAQKEFEISIGDNVYWGNYHYEGNKLFMDSCETMDEKGNLVDIYEPGIPDKLHDIDTYDKVYSKLEDDTKDEVRGRFDYDYAAGGEIGTKYKLGDFVFARPYKNQSIKVPFIVSHWSHEGKLEPATAKDFDDYYGEGKAKEYLRALNTDEYGKPMATGGKVGNEITYKGKNITILLSGWYQFYSDKQGRFIKCDTLSRAKEIITEEAKKEAKKEDGGGVGDFTAFYWNKEDGREDAAVEGVFSHLPTAINVAEGFKKTGFDFVEVLDDNGIVKWDAEYGLDAPKYSGKVNPVGKREYGGTSNRKWMEIKNDFTNDEGVTHIDAFLTEDDNEEGKVIATIDKEGNVTYIDGDAKTDPYAQEMIKEITDQKFATGGKLENRKELVFTAKTKEDADRLEGFLNGSATIGLQIGMD